MGWVFIASLVVALAVAYRPVGDYMYRVLTTTKHLRAESTGKLNSCP